MSENLIDVRDLIGRYSNAEHIARADKYFSAIPDDALLLRKPFFGLHDTPANLYGVSEVLRGLNLFPDARVLDFGAGTGWLSRALACIGCRPIACDVSAAALGLGRRAIERDPVARDLAIDWRPFDGVTLPLESGSVDRVICYDSFHHVADQGAILREFFRVLGDGGIVGFHEPGPNHSRAPVSQYEMRHHDVIENDIVMEQIWRLAEGIGFTGLELALAAPVSARVGLDRYNRIVGGGSNPNDIAGLLTSVVRGADNLRIFFLKKGEEVEDSRHGRGLAGTFAVTLTETSGDTLRGTATATNTGAVRWRASVAEAGAVWLGVKQPGAAGAGDYGRVKLSDGGIAPGESVEVDFTLPAPYARPTELLFDLVAEHVAWFELFGTHPVILRID